MENNITAIEQLQKAKEMNEIPDVKRGLYSIKDEDMGFGDVINLPNHMIALRTFAQICNDEKNNIRICPEKFSLFYLGYYSSATGKCTPVEPVKLGEASAYVQKKDK